MWQYSEALEEMFGVFHQHRATPEEEKTSQKPQEFDLSIETVPMKKEAERNGFYVVYKNLYVTNPTNIFEYVKGILHMYVNNNDPILMDMLILEMQALHKWDNLRVDSLHQGQMDQKSRCVKLFNEVQAQNSM